MTSKDFLNQLEKEGSYVFHGSEYKLEILEPRQAYTIVDGKKIDDDKPSVHASPVADIAIFMALINKLNCPGGYRSGFEYDDRKKKVVFTATRKTLDQLKNARGFVHVFDKDSFRTRTLIESISYDPVKPVKIIEVGTDDIPKEIEILVD